MKREIAEKSGVTFSTRTEKIVRKCIKELNLDLPGFTVLTEAASGNYIATPLVAATAGAAKTIAIAKDSKYGKADDVAKSLLFSVSSFGVERDSIEIVKSLSPETIGKVDIVTNLGFVRPINKHFISRLKLPLRVVQSVSLIRKIKPDILHAFYLTNNGVIGVLSSFHPLSFSFHLVVTLQQTLKDSEYSGLLSSCL